MDIYKIADSRLEAAAAFYRRGNRLADIGTDHASLPIYLVGSGSCPYAVACDINQGPLRAAERNIKAAGLDGKIDIFLTDGLMGIESFDPEDIFILGMGGELILRIIEASELPLRDNIRLILQPMTHAQDLRQGLYNMGFNIVDETLVTDRSRVYQILVAEYDGISRRASKVELLLGRRNIERGGKELCRLASVYASAIKKKLEGYAIAGIEDDDLNELYDELLRVVKENDQ